MNNSIPVYNGNEKEYWEMVGEPDPAPALTSDLKQPHQPQPKPAWPSTASIEAGYFVTPLAPTTGVINGVRYFQTVMKVGKSIVKDIFDSSPQVIEIALTAMDGKLAIYRANGRLVEQPSGIIPVPMIPQSIPEFHIPITMYYYEEGIRYFVELQSGGDHNYRKVLRHPLIYKNKQIIFDYGTSF